MSNPMFNPQPNYSGVTIQIANPAVNVNPNGNIPQGVAVRNGNYAACPQACYCECHQIPEAKSEIEKVQTSQYGTNPIQERNQEYAQYADSGYPQAYPAQYYLNNYSNPTDSSDGISKTNKNNTSEGITDVERTSDNVFDSSAISENSAKNSKNFIAGENLNINEEPNINENSRVVDGEAGISHYKDYAKSYGPKQPDDTTASKTIINALDERNEEIKEAKKNTKETKIVALTDEYIMSLENYLNNPNDEIRLMASKEILTRLDEDKDRYDDAALNALLNKMLQDPSKMIRLAALSAFGSQLASGNDYTVQLLQNIQSNPNADKEDALQAADILLKMSAGVEVKNVPESEVKREQYKMKVRKQAQA